MILTILLCHLGWLFMLPAFLRLKEGNRLWSAAMKELEAWDPLNTTAYPPSFPAYKTWSMHSQRTIYLATIGFLLSVGWSFIVIILRSL